jgi:hypothetical protein
LTGRTDLDQYPPDVANPQGDADGTLGGGDQPRAVEIQAAHQMVSAISHPRPSVCTADTPVVFVWLRAQAASESARMIGNRAWRSFQAVI